MRTIIAAAATALISASLDVSLSAHPLAREQVAGDAKWLVHLDFTHFRKTQLGGYIFNEILDKQMPQAESAIKAAIGTDLPWRAIESLTAYGTDFKGDGGEKGATIVNVSTNIGQVLDQALASFTAKMQAAGGNAGPAPFTRETVNGMTVYKFQEELAVAIPRTNLLVVSKKMSTVNEACGVITGKGLSMKSSKAFADFPAEPPGFFLLAAAEGFAQTAELPPQAKVFQMADGARIILGEQGQNLFVNLVLKAKNSDSAQQMQQVFQGLMALALLNPQANKDLSDLVQGIKIGGTEKTVSVGLNFPVTKALDHLKQAHFDLNNGFGGPGGAFAAIGGGDHDPDQPQKVRNKEKKAQKKKNKNADVEIEGDGDVKPDKAAPKKNDADK